MFLSRISRQLVSGKAGAVRSFTRHYPLSASTRSITSGVGSFRDLTPELVVFDKDGTLIDFHGMWGGWIEDQAFIIERAIEGDRVKDAMFEAFGYDQKERTVADGSPLTVSNTTEMHEIARDLLKDLGFSEQTVEGVLRDHWETPCPVARCLPLTDIGQLWTKIKQMGIKVAVCTMDDRHSAEESFRHLGVLSLLDAMVCGDDGFPEKPAPDGIWSICNTLGVDIRQTIMVGDTDADMRLARNSGCMMSIGILGGGSPVPVLKKEADMTVANPSAVLEVVRAMMQESSVMEISQPHSGQNPSVGCIASGLIAKKL